MKAAVRIGRTCGAYGKRSVAEVLVHDRAAWERLCADGASIQGQWEAGRGVVVFGNLAVAQAALQEVLYVTN